MTQRNTHTHTYVTMLVGTARANGVKARTSDIHPYAFWLGAIYHGGH